MYAVYVHRDEGLTVMNGPYASAIEAHQARMEYVAAAKRNGFKARRGVKVTFLKAKGVRLEVWVDRVENLN